MISCSTSKADQKNSSRKKKSKNRLDSSSVGCLFLCLWVQCFQNVYKLFPKCFRRYRYRFRLRLRFRFRFRIKKRHNIQQSSIVSYYAQKKSQNQSPNSHDVPRIAISQKFQKLHLYFFLLLCMIYINNKTESRRYDYWQVVPDAV